MALVIFLVKFLLKSVSMNRTFFVLWRRDPCGLGVAVSDAVARSLRFPTQSVSAGRIVMAASRLLRTAAACVILLSFAAGFRK